MVWIALQFDHTTIFDFGKQAAAPHAHFTHAGEVSVAVGVQLPILTCGMRHHRRDELSQCDRADRRTAQF